MFFFLMSNNQFLFILHIFILLSVTLFRLWILSTVYYSFYLFELFYNDFAAVHKYQKINTEIYIVIAL